MKVFELLNSLTIEEKKYVKKYFFSKSELLQNLFIEIYQIDEEKFKSIKIALFRKIYKKVWTNSSDRYLWNQMTNLYDELRAFVSQYWIDIDKESIELNKTIKFLLNLRIRNQIELFEKEWNYYFTIFDSKQNYYGLAELYLLQFNHLSRNPKTISKSIEALKQAYLYKLMASWEDVTSIQYTAFTSNYSKEIYGLENSITYHDFEIMKENLEHQFFNPLKSANLLLTETNADKKWEYVLVLFKILKSKDFQIKDSIKFKLCQSIFNYAIILTYNDELAKPRMIFEFLMTENLIESTVINSAVFYFNYSTLLLKIGETESAVIMHRQIMENLEGVHESKITLFIIRNIYLNILNGDFADVFKDISEITPRLFKEDQQMYVRLLLIMYLIESGDIDSAIREAENAKKSTGMKAEIAAEEAKIVEFIHSILLCINKENYNQVKLNKTEALIINTEFWIKSSNLLKIWVQKFINNIKGGKIYN